MTFKRPVFAKFMPVIDLKIAADSVLPPRREAYKWSSVERFECLLILTQHLLSAKPQY